MSLGKTKTKILIFFLENCFSGQVVTTVQTDDGVKTHVTRLNEYFQ